MKKLLAIVLCAALALCAASALAEPTAIIENITNFDMTIEFPADAMVDQSIVNDDMTVIAVRYEDENKPNLDFVIAPSEEYTEVHLGDLNTEDLEAVFATVAAQLDAPTYQIVTTAGGLTFMLIEENTDEYDVADFFTIYDGYCIQAYISYADYRTVTEDDIAAITAILDTLTITEVAK